MKIFEVITHLNLSGYYSDIYLIGDMERKNKSFILNEPSGRKRIVRISDVEYLHIHKDILPITLRTFCMEEKIKDVLLLHKKTMSGILEDEQKKLTTLIDNFNNEYKVLGLSFDDNIRLKKEICNE